MNIPDLKKLFKFDDYDLNANRNGRLSAKQEKRLTEDARAERRSARDSAGILLVFALLGFGMGLLIVVNAPVLAGKVLIGLMLCVLWPLAWGRQAWMIWRSVPSENQGQVRAVSGRARVIRDGQDFILEVEGRQFDLDKNPGGVIPDGVQITVYFLERTEEILSVDAE